MTAVSVLAPWRAGDPWRHAARDWVKERYAAEHPDWEIVEGTSPDGPFSRTAALLDAASRATGDVFVVADLDVWVPLDRIVPHTLERGWARPWRLIHRLSRDSTVLVLGGEDWRGLPLSTDNEQDSAPYTGNETGTLMAITRELFEAVPPDPRFRGWGQEDEAWGFALHCLHGRPWRGKEDLVHLWHPAAPRQDRVIGNDENRALLRRYRLVKNDVAGMRALLAETG